MNRQASNLDQIINSNWGNEVSTVLDVACGIGTQAIGLAGLKYKVSGSDLSPKAIQRAKKETKKRGLNISFKVSDMREASSVHSIAFDVLICCDNSLPHLLTDHEILKALKEFYRCLKPGGGCLISVRDYDVEDKTSLKIKPYKVQVVDGTTYILFQIWEFTGDIYDMSLYMVIDDGRNKAKTKIFRTKYYAVSVSKVMRLMRDARFKKVRRLDSEFYQPVIIGTK